MLFGIILNNIIKHVFKNILSIFVKLRVTLDCSSFKGLRLK